MVARVLASVVFIPCLIVITRRGGLHFLALIDIVIAVGMWEFYALMRGKGIRPYRRIGITCGIVLSWYMFFQNGVYANVFLTLVMVAITSLELTRRDNRMAIYHISTTLFGVVYVSFMISHLILLRELPVLIGESYEMGHAFVFLAFGLTWALDTGAFLVGSVIGKHPLLLRVSEKKTWEGALGGLVFATAAALGARHTFAGFLELWQALVLGLAIAIAGTLGDLVESMIKRDVAVKDASSTIPGHGGVLDRFDSLLFTAPLLYYFLKFVIFKQVT